VVLSRGCAASQHGLGDSEVLGRLLEHFLGVPKEPVMTQTITVVWVANREALIMNNTCGTPMLSLTNGSNLVMSDGNGSHIFRSSDMFTAPTSSLSFVLAVAVLLSTSNLIIHSTNGTTMW
jgi:hypothetical protein